jgi:uncharacterized phage protein gp47/JayE
MQLYDRGTLINRMISAVRARTSAITYFGPGPFRAFLYAVAGEVQHLYYKMFQVEQRLDPLSAQGAALDAYAAGRGLSRLGANEASTILEVEADAVINGTGTITATGTSVTGINTTFLAELAQGDLLIVNDQTVTVTSAVTTNTGPVTVSSALTGVTDEAFQIQKVAVTLASTPTPLQASTASGAIFQAVETVTMKPSFQGSTTLRAVVRARSLATGSSLNVPALAIRNVLTPEVAPKLSLQVRNPAAAQGGAEAESDANFRTRILTLFAGLNQGTPHFYESQVRTLNSRVVRIFLARGGQLNEVAIYCATADGSPLTAPEKQTLLSGLLPLVPVQTIVSIRDMILQEVNVAFTTTLATGATIQQVANDLAGLYREYLNWSTWPFGQAVQADDLLRLASSTPGVDSLTLSSFSPQNDLPMATATLPRVGTITVTDATTGQSSVVTQVLSIYPNV